MLTAWDSTALNNMDLGIFSLDVWVGACGVLCVCVWVSVQTHFVC